MKALALLLLLFALDPKPTKVQISVQKVDKDEITFQPLVPASFTGILTGEVKSKITNCEVQSEAIAKLASGSNVEVLILRCGDAKIVVQGVTFF